MIGGFLSKALLALLVYLEEETVPSAVCCGYGVPLLLVYLASSPPIHDFVEVVFFVCIITVIVVVVIIIIPILCIFFLFF